MSKKTVIIGGVAGGATAAARLRRRDEDREIVILERGPYISYANCGLPYYVGNVIENRESLLLQTPENMKNKFNIDVRTSHEVTKILPDERSVEIKNLNTGEVYQESYDDLIVATGSSPLRPPIPGIDGENIFTIWSIPDTDAITKLIREKKPKRAAVIGGGFIGLEMVENLQHAGIDVSVIEMQNQVMAPLDLEMANLLHENMQMNQVELILEDGVSRFESHDDKTNVVLNSGKTVEVDIVILSIGVKPNSELAVAAGLQTNERKGIVVDEQFCTSAEHIYAVGDVIGIDHFVTKEKTMIPLAGPANKQARMAADILCGDAKRYKGATGVSVAKVFDLNAACVGVNEKSLKRDGKVKNRDYFTVLINQKSHAGYYPGATTLTLKMIFDQDGKILGAQIVGQDGVDKRIDTITTTMRLEGTIYDLTEMEFAYAPPFSSAKDPVNMLGFVAENVLNGLVSFIEWDEMDAETADEEQRGKCVILDVTEKIERQVFEIPNSYHIPLGQLRNRMEELDKDKHIIVYCAIGVRSYNGARILMQNGFKKVSVLSGGTAFYKSMHYRDGRVEKCEGGNVLEEELGQSVNQNVDAAKTLELKELNCCGLQCPGPIMKVYEAMEEMQDTQVLKVSATDMGFVADIASWCRRTGNTMVKQERVGKENIVYIQKGETQKCTDCGNGSAIPLPSTHNDIPEGKTIIVFSGDLDKTLASFIIANGAAAMGRPVTMFFTFWGLNVLRKSTYKAKHKPIMDKMFGAMMPKGSQKLKLSKMNMGGMGTAMMKKVMRDKNVDSLETLMQHAINSGVKLVACTMSMDIMGISKEELIDGVEYAGVATYLGDAEESNVNLFI